MDCQNQPSTKGKMWKIVGIVVACVIVIFILLVWWGSSIDNQQTGNSESITNNINTMPVTFKEFFPNISGNLSDYKINLPEGYITYAVPEDLAPGTVLWGSPSDIKTITADPDTIAFDKSTAGVFRVRFTKNVGVGPDGRISDIGGPIIDETSLANEGMEDVHFIKGSLFGIAGVPVIAFTGNQKNKPVYMAYLYSPADNLVLFVNLQGGTDDKANAGVWDSFVTSLNIKP